MPNLSAAFRRKLRLVAPLAAVLMAVSLFPFEAQARHRLAHHRHGYFHCGSACRGHFASRYGSERSFQSESNVSAIVVDGNSGQTLYARGENQQRFPASITKVMTLYLLFEQLQQGRMRLDSEIPISAYAAFQKPTKLGLRPGESIRVDDAIKAVVTRSANDIAVAIAERIGGDEPHFAALMTQKARELGMNSTHFSNASGLPDPGQLTTARDLAVLGVAIEERFPRYYRYFATRVFYYRHRAIANHNHLLGRIDGMDGIKTGYTNASGFNLLASVKRGGHYIVAAVLGGASAGSRDRIMARLVEDHIGAGATIRTASLAGEARAEAQAQASKPLQGFAIAAPKLQLQSIGAFQPLFQADGSGNKRAPDPLAFAPLDLSDMRPPKPRPAFVPGASRQAIGESRAPVAEQSPKQARVDSSTASEPPAESAPPVTPSALRGPPNLAQPLPAKLMNRAGEIVSAKIAQSRPQKVEIASAGAGETSAGTGEISMGAEPSGWMIQIAATPNMDKAAELLARARLEGPKTLARARAFTEKIQKGPETLYRARFAGLGEDSAALACKSLRRSGFSCFAIRN